MRGKSVLACAACLVAFVPAAHGEQAVTPLPHPGPGETLYLQLSNTELDPTRVFRVRDASLDRDAIHVTLDDGTIAFTRDVMGKITGAFFEGEGEVLLAPPDEVERRSMSLFTGMAILEERFSTAYFRFNDDAVGDLRSGLRAAEDPEKFIAQWNETAKNLAHQDAMRLLATFSQLLPVSGDASGSAVAAGRLGNDDRMLHARVQGNKLGVFDLFFDSTATEQVQAGQSRTSEDGTAYYDVWTSFAAAQQRKKRNSEKEIPENLPPETESHEDSMRIHGFVIDARVKPPKELDAHAQLQLDVLRPGSRFLLFEMSRFLQIQSVTQGSEENGDQLEFVQNPAVEGTRLARSGDDLVAVILPKPARRGEKITLHFVYGGEVLADAGKGLLYVGARGTWYPNRGLALADFDLTFHYPTGWTLLATGKPTPLSQSSRPEPTLLPGNENQQVERFVSERPLPVAGFNLGKYVRASAQAGSVVVETYATNVVEREFPKPEAPAIEVAPPGLNPKSSPAPMPSIAPAPAAPSPARNAEAVAENAARAVDYYAARFGPYPYTRLALTQMPGRESQGWPGLVFLSSYAFLNREEREEIHMTPVGALIDQIIPAHEAAHQWWGDLVTWATYRDQWFSEGLANYCALMMLHEKNPAGFKLVMEKYRDDLASKTKEGSLTRDAGPVTLGSRLLSSHLPEGYEAIGYGRGTWLFYMLHSMLLDAAQNLNAAQNKDAAQKPNTAQNKDQNASPDDPFVRGLRKVRERYQGKAITTRELLDVFAEDLPPSLRYQGRASLDWFLDGWVNGTALPTFDLQNVKFTGKANSIVATGVIRQENAPEDLVTSVPVYAVLSGKVTTLIGRVFADGPVSSFHLTAPPGTRKLLLDPNGTVLTAPK
ncbi:MAG: M1 family aminopeptidase [Candidatus Sulfotelmatobacter sp.]